MCMLGPAALVVVFCCSLCPGVLDRECQIMKFAFLDLDMIYSCLYKVIYIIIWGENSLIVLILMFLSFFEQNSDLCLPLLNWDSNTTENSKLCNWICYEVLQKIRVNFLF